VVCVIVTAWPPIDTTPVRGAVDEFASKANVTAPKPDPLAPLVTVIHVAGVVADQPHCVPVMTLTVLLPAPRSTVKLVGVTL
jgi:hypothetical protein